MRICTSFAPAARHHPHNLARSRPADDRVVDQDNALAFKQRPHRVQLHAHAEVAHPLLRLNKRAPYIVVADQPEVERNPALRRIPDAPPSRPNPAPAPPGPPLRRSPAPAAAPSPRATAAPTAQRSASPAAQSTHAQRCSSPSAWSPANSAGWSRHPRSPSPVRPAPHRAHTSHAADRTRTSRSQTQTYPARRPFPQSAP